MHPMTNTIENETPPGVDRSKIKKIGAISAVVVVAGLIVWAVVDRFTGTSGTEAALTGSDKNLQPLNTPIPQPEKTPVPEAVIPGVYSKGPWQCLPLKAKNDWPLNGIRILRGQPDGSFVPAGQGPYALDRKDGTLIELSDYGQFQNQNPWPQPGEGVCILKPSSFVPDKTVFKADSRVINRLGRESVRVRAQIRSTRGS
jgi:hypothetical protein